MQNLGYFGDIAELTLKVYISMESNMYGFPKQTHCFQRDLAASRKKIHVLHGKSEVPPKGVNFSWAGRTSMLPRSSETHT